MSFVKFNKKNLQTGFSLIEMAIVLVILGLLLGGLILPLSSQHEVAQRQATERQLQEIRNAIIGFVQANNRFPCPAALNGNGTENRSGTPLICNTPNGFLPFQALGMEGTFLNGNIVDAWQQPFRYRVTNPAGANWIYTRSLTPFPTQLANLRICSDSACAANQVIATEIVAVVFSTGRDGADVPASVSPDQLENLNANNDFVMRPKTGDDRTNFEFDDILVWISRSTLTYELGRTGQ